KGSRLPRPAEPSRRSVAASEPPSGRHLAHQGIRLVYIKARTPQLTGKVERSHRMGSAGVLPALELHGRCGSGEAAGRVGGLLQLPPAARRLRGQNALRGAPGTATVTSASVRRDPLRHTLRSATISSCCSEAPNEEETNHHTAREDAPLQTGRDPRRLLVRV